MGSLTGKGLQYSNLAKVCCSMQRLVALSSITIWIDVCCQVGPCDESKPPPLQDGQLLMLRGFNIGKAIEQEFK